MLENTQTDTTTILKVGEPFALVLEAQMGAGFQWIMEGACEGLVFLQKEGQLTKEDANNADLQRLVRSSKGEGVCLTFLYHRPSKDKTLTPKKPFLLYCRIVMSLCRFRFHHVRKPPAKTGNASKSGHTGKALSLPGVRCRYTGISARR